jgi:hypothetical protein
VLSERLLKRFVSAIETSSNVESRAPSPLTDTSLPEDYARFLRAVAGWRAVRDLRLTSPADWSREKDHWDALSRAYEVGGGNSPRPGSESEDRFAGPSPGGAANAFLIHHLPVVNFSHAFWSQSWLPLGHDNSHLQFAYAPDECFGGPAGQVIAFDFKGGVDWTVFPSLDGWLDAMLVVLEMVPARDVASGCLPWAIERKAAVVVPLPAGEAARRAPERFHAGDSEWIELRHADGSAWAIRARRGSYQLRIGAPDDAIYRDRACANPTQEVTRLIAEQEAEGFRRVGAAGTRP